MITSPERILITGATGFVGRHLTGLLATAFPNAAMIAATFDLGRPEEITKSVRDISPDTCIHLGAIATPAQALRDQEMAWRINLHGTLHLADAILRHAPECQFIFASSADAYGASFRNGMKLDETAPLAPLNLYTATKAAADLTLGSLVGQGLRLVRLRCVNATGTGQDVGLVVAAFAKQVAEIAAGLREPIVQVGNLEPRRDFLDVRDVCTAYAACIARRDELEPGVIFNIASGVPRRIGEILEALKTMAGVVATSRIDPMRVRSTDVTLAVCDAARAKAALGWEATIPWLQTLHDVMTDWRREVSAMRDSP